MPRMTTRLNLQADRPGVYDGLSSHFSGDGFPGHAVQGPGAVPPTSSRCGRKVRTGPGSALDGRGYAELSKPSSYVKPMTYGAVAPGLFDAIVANRAPPNPAPPPPHNQPTLRQPERMSMFGKAHLGRDPVQSADPADHLARRARSRLARSPSGSRCKGWWPYLWNEYITSTDHKRIGIMYIVLGAGDAGARLCRCDHDARAAVARDRRVAGLSAARALRPDLLRARHDHDLLRGDAVRHRAS